MSRFIQVQTTVDSKKLGERLVQDVLEESLAAWGTVNGPVSSLYLEEGKLNSTQEWICTFWTRSELYERIEREILKNHPYEDPTVASLPVLDGNRAFTKWIDEETEE